MFTRKSVHKISLLQASMYFDTLDNRVLFTGFFRKKREKRFIEDFNAMFSGSDLKNTITESQYMLYIYGKAFNLYPALYGALSLALKGNDIKLLEKLFNDFKNEFGFEFTKIADLEYIDKKIKFYKSKYKGLQDNNKTNESNEKFDFEKMIVSIEHTLEVSINRSLKVFQLKAYFDRAVSKSKK